MFILPRKVKPNNHDGIMGRSLTFGQVEYRVYFGIRITRETHHTFKSFIKLNYITQATSSFCYPDPQGQQIVRRGVVWRSF